MNLNQRALGHCQGLIRQESLYRTKLIVDETGVRIVDCGVRSQGGVATGLRMAEVCMAALGQVQLVPGSAAVWPGPWVAVATDHPVAACMASQYAGWRLADGDFFAMGSGPMRAAAGQEPLIDQLARREQADAVVGILECAQYPPASICRRIATQCGVPPERVTLLVAPTASNAGGVQIVARSVETALHKLHELEFDLNRIVSGWGVAPLPPVARNDLAAIGRTNDAILYGADVTLWARGDDASIEAVGALLPSNASPDHGRPFAEIFAAYHGDFYQIDPHLFSPARVQLINLDSGRTFQFGALEPEILRHSFLD